jgi:hypothetical protein
MSCHAQHERPVACVTRQVEGAGEDSTQKKLLQRANRDSRTDQRSAQQEVQILLHAREGAAIRLRDGAYR